MDTEDWSWLSVIAGFSECESPDDLVDSLLQADDAHQAKLEPFPSPWLEQGDVKLRTRTSPSPSSSSSSTASASKADAASSSTVVCRGDTAARSSSKRKRNMRPKEEIEYLKGSVVDLENLVNLLRQRQQAGLAPTVNKAIKDANANVDDHSGESIWVDVASRQYKYLRASQAENDKLRSQVRNQIHIIRGLVRLIERAQRGLPTQLVPPSLVLMDDDRFMTKRLELLDRAMQMNKEIDGVIRGEPFISSSQELMEMTLYQHGGDVIPPGTALGTSWLRRRLPHAVETMSDAFWESDPTSSVSSDSMKMEYIERSPDRQIMQFQMRFWGPNGPIRHFGVAVRLRNRNAPRHAIMMTSSVWPSPTNSSPWNCVGMDLEQWSLVNPSNERSTETQTEVLVKTQASKLARSFSAVRADEAAVLQSWISQSMSFTMEKLQCDIDSILLGHSITPAV